MNSALESSVLLDEPGLPRARSQGLGDLAGWGGTIFLSAFLLFELQPILAKIILPWFGGGAGVWTTSLVFFQTAYLLGNLYAHLLIRREYTLDGPNSHCLACVESCFAPNFAGPGLET